MRLSTTVVSALVAAAAAAPAPQKHVLHEKRDFEPKEWVKGKKLNADSMMPMRFGLTQRNLDKGYDMLMDVSKHDSPNYGKHYTADEVNDIFAPSKESVAAVRAWLESAGIAKERITQSYNKQWIQLDATAEEMEQILKAQYHVFEHAPTGKTNVACDEYHVPSHVQEHVDYITPGIKLHAVGKAPTPEQKAKRSEEHLQAAKNSYKVPEESPLEAGNNYHLPNLLASLPLSLAAILDGNLLDLCGLVITPNCIKEMYQIPVGTRNATGNELGVFEDLGDVYSQTDLDMFWNTFYNAIPQGTGPELKAIDGAVAPNPVTSAGPESDLDFQISYPIVYPQGEILFQTDDPNYESDYEFEGFLNNFLDAIDGSYCSYSAFGETGNSPLDPPYPDPAANGYKGQLQCGVYDPTNVISISYGGDEADLPASYQQRQCNEYMKLGMQGVSVVVASGDSGVEGSQCLGANQKIFSPDFPASCPYIITVGATTLPAFSPASNDNERAVTRFASGGGFSNIYPIPDYQQAAVSNYLATTTTYPSYNITGGYTNSTDTGNGLYNRAGRGYPDFSAVGDNIVIYNMGLPTIIGGTSASAPVFAAILTRINDERIAANKGTVGFVNPTLYANPQVFHDVTVGTNPGCGTNGFSAATGWDPLTGLGTPVYPKMLSLFMGLQ